MPDASLSGMGSVSSVVAGDPDVPPPYSDSTDSEDERRMALDEIITCPVPHEGREMLSMVMPISVDELFTLLFTSSSFYIDFIQNTRKYTGNYRARFYALGVYSRNASVYLQICRWNRGKKVKTQQLSAEQFRLPFRWPTLASSPREPSKRRYVTF